MFTNLTTAINAAVDGEIRGTVTFEEHCSLGFISRLCINNLDLTFPLEIKNTESVYFKCYESETPQYIQSCKIPTNLLCPRIYVQLCNVRELILQTGEFSASEKIISECHNKIQMEKDLKAVNKYLKTFWGNSSFRKVQEACEYIQGLRSMSFSSKENWKEFLRNLDFIRQEIFTQKNDEETSLMDVNEFLKGLEAFKDGLVLDEGRYQWFWRLKWGNFFFNLMKKDNKVFYFTCGNQETKHYRFINGDVVEYTNVSESRKELSEKRKSMEVKDSRKRFQEPASPVEGKEVYKPKYKKKKISHYVSAKRPKQTKSTSLQCYRYRIINSGKNKNLISQKLSLLTDNRMRRPRL